MLGTARSGQLVQAQTLARIAGWKSSNVPEHCLSPGCWCHMCHHAPAMEKNHFASLCTNEWFHLCLSMSWCHVHRAIAMISRHQDTSTQETLHFNLDLASGTSPGIRHVQRNWKVKILIRASMLLKHAGTLEQWWSLWSKNGNTLSELEKLTVPHDLIG